MHLLDPLLPNPNTHISWGGLHGASLGLAIVEAAKQASELFVIVLEDQRLLEILQREISFFLSPDSGIAVYSFLSWECLPYDNFSPNQEVISERLKLLSLLPHLHQGIVLIQTSNLMQKLPPVDYVLGHTFTLEIGQNINLEKLKQQFVDANYLSVNQVIAPGEFAIRGGLVDVFPMGSEVPYRLDLFDDELETLRSFDPQTQRSNKQVNQIALLPAREFPMSEEAIKLFRSNFRRHFEGDPRKQMIYTEVSQGNTPAGVEFYFPLFFNETACFFDYLPQTHTFITSDSFTQTIRTTWAEIEDRYANASHDISHRVLPPQFIYLDHPAMQAKLDKKTRISLIRNEQIKVNWSANSLATKAYPVDVKKEKPYQSLISYFQSISHPVLLLTETPGRQESMESVLIHHGIHTRVIQHFDAFSPQKNAGLQLAIAEFERGMWIQQPEVEIICESQLYGERVFQRRRRSQTYRDPESIIKSLAELNIDDPVVHVEYGVGRYKGLQLLDIAGSETEFLCINYQDEDKLYVPITSLNLISRFLGSAKSAPLHRLGSEQWLKAKKRAHEKAYDVATELLEIEAFRKARKGVSYKIAENELASFSSNFPFEETPDQTQAIEEVIRDMVSDEPMDRLVCGDVGFGKTEVALRAAFIAATAGQQVAILTPTTLLAQQHYHTFIDRFNPWPINIGLLSRFNTDAQTRDVLKRVASGNIDIVVGTHKLLQDDMKYKNLGLLIIDEEHRFGVRQKDKIKRLRSQVDVLTLTATPIPRTLNITMSGMRTMSIIATPPNNRLAIKTYIRPWNVALIKEACTREIRRGGQVFFLHNDVKSIEIIAKEIKELIPEATVNIGHGQMREIQLERIMQDFYHQRFNILVCSTIIDSGIDIPSANTIIINRADKFGLAQLHQLRGRVGRAHHQAFAYLLTPEPSAMTKDAKKRLDAIGSLQDLGAGFTLASHDLEIRGAGELLGETQSGSIDEVGFSLYNEYLGQAINAIKQGKLDKPGLEIQMEKHTSIDLHIPALFPSDYLPNAHNRLLLYKRISSAISDAQLDELQIEVIDRFGLMPDQAKNLFLLTSIRLKAQAIEIQKAEIGENGGMVVFHESPKIDIHLFLNLIHQNPNIYKLTGPTTLQIKGKYAQVQERIDILETLITTLNQGTLS